VKLKAFSKFDNTTEALAAATALVESKLSKGAHKNNSCSQLLHHMDAARHELLPVSPAVHQQQQQQQQDCMRAVVQGRGIVQVAAGA
jgi:hypothetical protein